MIGRVLPNNGMVGENVKFDRIRRITGYLVEQRTGLTTQSGQRSMTE